MLYCPKCKQPVAEEAAVITDGNTPKCPACLAELSNRKIFSAGMEINGFTIIREIGHGGMGVVYLAEQNSLKRQVALKVLEETLADDREFVEAFFREARSAAKLAHPNIVQAFDAGVTNDGICFFVMELIDGDNLDVIVSQNGPLSLKLGLEVGCRIAEALAYAWDHMNMSHGDIKPENIILHSNGEIKLADLGLARDHRTDQLKPGEIMATPAYAPPEVIRGEVERIGFKSDMYSFGATLYHLFAGAPPFPGEAPQTVCEQQLNSQPRPLLAVNDKIPAKLSMLVDKLMEKSPDHRPASWNDVAEELNRISTGCERKDVPQMKIISGPSFYLTHKKQIYVSLAALLLLIVLTLTGFLIFGGDEKKPRPAKVTPPVVTDSKQKVKPAVSPQEMKLKALKNEAKTKWNFLKQEIKSLTPDKAHSRVNEFCVTYKNHAPVEAQKLQAELAKQASFYKRKQILGRKINILLQEEKKHIGLNDKDNIPLIQEKIKQINSLLNELEQDDRMAKMQNVNIQFVENNQKMTLIAYRDTLQTEVDKRIAEQKRQKEERERLKKERQQARMAQEAAAEAAKEDLQKIINTPPASPDDFKQWAEKIKKYRNTNFISASQRRLFHSFTPIVDRAHLIEHPVTLLKQMRSKCIPFGRYRSMTEKGVIVFNYLKIGSRIEWKDLDVLEEILIPQIAKMTADEQKQVLFAASLFEKDHFFPAIRACRAGKKIPDRELDDLTKAIHAFRTHYYSAGN